MSNIVDAISDMHEELSGDVATLKTDVTTLKTDMAGVKTDVEKLLHHFGIASGGSP